MNLIATSSAAASPAKPAGICVCVLVALSLWNPALASDSTHPISISGPAAQEVSADQATQTVQNNKKASIDAATAILAEQAMQPAEPGLGAALPSAAASYGALTAAEKANAQLVASALAKQALTSTQVRPPVIAASQAANSGDLNQLEPNVSVNTLGGALPNSDDGSSGLTINISLPAEVLEADELGNPKNITINLAFP